MTSKKQNGNRTNSWGSPAEPWGALGAKASGHDNRKDSQTPRAPNRHLTPTFPSIIFQVMTHLASMVLWDVLHGNRWKQPNSKRPSISLAFALRKSSQFCWISSFAMPLGSLPSDVANYAKSKRSPSLGTASANSLRKSTYKCKPPPSRTL